MLLCLLLLLSNSYFFIIFVPSHTHYDFVMLFNFLHPFQINIKFLFYFIFLSHSLGLSLSIFLTQNVVRVHSRLRLFKVRIFFNNSLSFFPAFGKFDLSWEKKFEEMLKNLSKFPKFKSVLNKWENFDVQFRIIRGKFSLSSIAIFPFRPKWERKRGTRNLGT